MFFGWSYYLIVMVAFKKRLFLLMQCMSYKVGLSCVQCGSFNEFTTKGFLEKNSKLKYLYFNLALNLLLYVKSLIL